MGIMPKRVYFLYMTQAPKQFNQLGVFSACLILLFSTLLATTNAFGANDVVLTTDQTTITLPIQGQLPRPLKLKLLFLKVYS
jgi:hypothetical protein